MCDKMVIYFLRCCSFHKTVFFCSKRLILYGMVVIGLKVIDLHKTYGGLGLVPILSRLN